MFNIRVRVGYLFIRFSPTRIRNLIGNTQIKLLEYTHERKRN